jgi:hypothetical protein
LGRTRTDAQEAAIRKRGQRRSVTNRAKAMTASLALWTRNHKAAGFKILRGDYGKLLERGYAFLDLLPLKFDRQKKPLPKKVRVAA